MTVPFRRFAIACLAALGFAAAALPAQAQIRISDSFDPNSRSALCVNQFGDLAIMPGDDDCSNGNFEVVGQVNQLTVGPAGSETTINATDGSATFNSSATFNGGVIHNGGTQFNGQVAFTGLTTATQLNSGSIFNSGQISTSNLNTGTLHATGTGSFSGALSSDSFFANAATIAALHVPGAAQFDTSVSVGGNLTARNVIANNGLAVAAGATVDMGGNRIQNIGAPIAGTDAANKDYVDSTFQSVQSGVAALGSQVADHETRLTTVENVNVQQETHLTAIDARDSAQDSHLTAIDTLNIAQNDHLTVIDGRDAVQDTHLSAIDAVNVGQDSRMTAIEAVNTQQSQQLDTLQDRVGGLQTDVAGLRRDIRRANGGIAAAVALGGTMMAPDSNVSLSFNLATYRGEQAYSGSVVGRVAKKVYVQAGFGGSTVRGSSAGRIGLTLGL